QRATRRGSSRSSIAPKGQGRWRRAWSDDLSRNRHRARWSNLGAQPRRRRRELSLHAAARRRATEARGSGRGMTDVPTYILVVEDEPQMQKFLRMSLASEGYRVVEASKGQEGIDLARTHNPDLVLLDLGLPTWTARTSRRRCASGAP